VKVLNLYAGIGGNRKLWPAAVHVDAVELNQEIAAVYADLYPGDNVIVGDAHAYLKEHFSEYDFIWTSPPCQTHTSFRQNICVRFRGSEAEYPDMKLYQEIIFLQHNASCKWVVENVVPYYEPLIKGKVVQRHTFWSNFPIPGVDVEQENLREIQIPELQALHGFDLSKYKLANKRQVLRNCVDPELGRAIFDAAMSGAKQTRLFEAEAGAGVA
jgi:DNA (cytosine-5)-methyltransferase 1